MATQLRKVLCNGFRSKRSRLEHTVHSCVCDQLWHVISYDFCPRERTRMVFGVCSEAASSRGGKIAGAEAGGRGFAAAANAEQVRPTWLPDREQIWSPQVRSFAPDKLFLLPPSSPTGPRYWAGAKTAGDSRLCSWWPSSSLPLALSSPPFVAFCCPCGAHADE